MNTVHALAAFVRLGWREATSDRFGLAGRLLLFSLPVLIFATIWRATPLTALEPDADRLAWYVMVTEAIIFSVGFAFREIEEDIRTGAIEAALTRPLAYTAARVAEEMGGTVFRVLAFLAFGVVLATLATGTIPIGWSTVPWLVATSILGGVLALLFQIVIGLSTVWVGTPAPVYWIWQKLVFVLGGLFIPVTLYPAWLRDASEATPFAAILFHPASLVLGGDPLVVLGWQALWIAAAAIAVTAIAAAATRRFVREGV